MHGASFNGGRPMHNVQRTTLTTENAESKSKEDCPLLSTTHQNVFGKIFDVNTTPKQSVDLAEHVQEADGQDGNSSKVYQSSVGKYKNLQKALHPVSITLQSTH